MLKINDLEKAYIVLGVGGTGSWLVPSLSKLGVNVLLIDGDMIEEKNVLRQNFSSEDVGFPKAKVMGEKFGFPFVTEFVDSVEMLEEIVNDFSDGLVPVIVGCLDNNGSRMLVHELFQKMDTIIWADSGNAERHGQTYVAVKENGEVKYPSLIDLDLAFLNTTGDERRPDQISCAEQSESAPQNVTANVTAASTLFSVLANINNSGILFGNKYAWNTNSVSGTSEEVLELQKL